MQIHSFSHFWIDLHIIFIYIFICLVLFFLRVFASLAVALFEVHKEFFIFFSEEPFEWKHYFLLRSFDYLSVQAYIQSGWKYK